MVTSRDLPPDRLAVGQLLVRLLRQFRLELACGAAALGYSDLREPHTQIFGNVGINGIRLTDLSSRAQLSLAAASDLVSDLEELGYLERKPDPSDGRAKLIFPTHRGRKALDDAGDQVAKIELAWGQLVGRPAFEDACTTLQRLLDAQADYGGRSD